LWAEGAAVVASCTPAVQLAASAMSAMNVAMSRFFSIRRS